MLSYIPKIIYPKYTQNILTETLNRAEFPELCVCECVKIDYKYMSFEISEQKNITLTELQNY
ncbi:unnamed protein product [marine sediment metagenome]|uniref:Uncharacterized protein n=1 Tax=marine sediment metagenome TaxID=412755 RepID=X1FLA7_9ZZZZ